jgi:hypothetical protein
MLVTPTEINLSTQNDPALMKSIQESLGTGALTRAHRKEHDDSDSRPRVDVSHAGRLLNALSGRGDIGESLFKLMKRALELVTGKKVDSLSVDQQSLNAGNLTLDEADATQTAQSGPTGSSLDAQYHTLHLQAQQLDFAASGTLKLKDGTEVAFSFELSVSQVYFQDTSASLHVQGDLAPQSNPALPANLTQLGDRHWHLGLDGAGLSALLPALEHEHGEHHHHGYPVPASPVTGSTNGPTSPVPMSPVPADTAPATDSATSGTPAASPAPVAPTTPTAVQTATSASSTSFQFLFSRQIQFILSGYTSNQAPSPSASIPSTLSLAA